MTKNSDPQFRDVNAFSKWFRKLPIAIADRRYRAEQRATTVTSVGQAVKIASGTWYTSRFENKSRTKAWGNSERTHRRNTLRVYVWEPNPKDGHKGWRNTGKKEDLNPDLKVKYIRSFGFIHFYELLDGRK
jgi:hypothetical protein